MSEVMKVTIYIHALLTVQRLPLLMNKAWSYIQRWQTGSCRYDINIDAVTITTVFHL